MEGMRTRWRSLVKNGKNGSLRNKVNIYGYAMDQTLNPKAMSFTMHSKKNNTVNNKFM